MKPEVLWQSKTTVGGAYENMLPLTVFGVDEEDLDNNSYRSVNSGNLIDTVISQSWIKLRCGQDGLTWNQLQSLLARLRYNPLYIRTRVPVFQTEWTEYKIRCSKKSYDMNQDGTWKISFNMVQKTKVTGQ